MNLNQISEMGESVFDPIRERVDVNVDALVEREGVVYRIAQVLDFETVIGVAVESGRSSALRVGELRVVSGDLAAVHSSNFDLEDIADEDWRIAEKRFAAISPLLDRSDLGRGDVELRAYESGVDTATLYRWMERYKAYRLISSLIPQKRGWKSGNGRISSEAESVINEVIRTYYLTSQRPRVEKVVTEVHRICLLKGIEKPSASTIRSRIAKVSEREKLKGRGFKEKANNKFSPAPGQFPNANYPLSVVQIDHTPVDIILVDDTHRKPIGRPWLTLAMDVYSRMVTGYYLSFDPPSETSVAMCVAHSMLPKEEWMTLHNVDADWPVWGVMRTIHVDNGAEFRSNNFQQSCSLYGIHLEYRPVKQPRYGGHIERMLGTLLFEIHDLPGTTFSSVAKREGYDSEKNAVITKSEFEEWLVKLITKVYHRRKHSSLGMTPFRQWELGIFGSGDLPGTGVPPRPVDRLSILLDFLPCFHRTVQQDGVTIDKLSYYSEALRPWIGALDEESGEKRLFVFRRDPRDITSIWFFDPVLKQYFRVPTSEQSLPPMSIWEYQQVREKLKLQGIESFDEHQVLHAITELREHVDKSKEKSKKARRASQRRTEHEKNISPANPLPAAPNVSPLPTTSLEIELSDGPIKSFGDIA